MPHFQNRSSKSFAFFLIALSLLVRPLYAEPFAVGVVRSDDPQLAQPAAPDQALTADQILDLVRRGVDHIGGMASVVPDTAKVVALKANISILEPSGSGVVTDARVIRAVALLVHEVAPEARILIAEGAGGWMSPAFRDCTDVEVSGRNLQDGFEVAGHRATVEELRGMGIDIDVRDLNFDRSYTMQVPGGGLATDEYDIAATLIDADVWINCPVAKTHGAKITCCMKNHFGILPGRLYGWPKRRGTENHGPMPHAPRVLDEAWVDLWTLSQVDLNVVDMIVGTEAGAFTGAPRRRNMILAGRDPVATDLVVAKVMGFNPDDFEFAELARQRGMGPGAFENVEVRGIDVQTAIERHKKASTAYGDWGEWSEHAAYGMGPRYWSLLGPLPKDHRFSAAEIATLAPMPGAGDWSPVIYFGHDKIDLDQHYDDPINASVYAFTRFTMPQADSVRFWAGSDEDLQVWLDGELIHEHAGRRRHRLGQDKVPGYVKAGEHLLLVRAQQGRGGFEFSFNVAEPIDDKLTAGNRYPGLRYYVEDEVGTQVADLHVRSENTGDDFFFAPDVGMESTIEAPDPVEVSRTAPSSSLIENMPHPSQSSLLGMAAELAGLQRADLDSTSLAGLSASPFDLGHFGFGKDGWAPEQGPDVSRLFNWLGLRYSASYGFEKRESLKIVKGWLTGGRVPLVSHSGWALATGYRESDGRTELHIVKPDTAMWAPIEKDWWGTLPGGVDANCPVIVVERGGDPLPPDALVDSVASLALELALRPWVPPLPGFTLERRIPAGLAAWDWWVTDWERRPWTPEWARSEWPRDRLPGTQRFLGRLAEERERAAAFFAGAAGRTAAQKRRALLGEAAEAYETAVQTFKEIQQALPETRGDKFTPEEERRVDQIHLVRPLLSRARDAERQALSALARLLGRPPLPPIARDALRHLDRGKKLFTWRADFSEGVYELTLRGEKLQIRLLASKEAEGMRYEVHNAAPREGKWQVAIQAEDTGLGFYQVYQNPAAENDWTAIVRADDEWTWDDNAPELVVWAVPVE